MGMFPAMVGHAVELSHLASLLPPLMVHVGIGVDGIRRGDQIVLVVFDFRRGEIDAPARLHYPRGAGERRALRPADEVDGQRDGDVATALFRVGLEDAAEPGRRIDQRRRGAAVHAALAVLVDVGNIDGDLGVALAPVGEAKAEKAVEPFGEFACSKIRHGAAHCSG